MHDLGRNRRPERGRAQRFREAALPHVGDVYTLARYLLRNPDDAEDAQHEAGFGCDR